MEKTSVLELGIFLIAFGCRSLTLLLASMKCSYSYIPTPKPEFGHGLIWYDLDKTVS